MKEIPVIIFGLEKTGSSLIEQLLKKQKAIADQNCTRFKIIAAVDNSHWFYIPEGLTNDALHTILARKQAGDPIGETARPSSETIIQILQTGGIQKGIVVDTTQDIKMESAMAAALSAGYSISTANSPLLSHTWHTAHKYYNNPQVRFESTLGGDLPITATLCYLSDIKDDFYKFEGQFLGPAAEIVSKLKSERVDTAAFIDELHQNDYSAADIADDLSGQSILRKLIIMGRVAGWPLEARDFEVEAFVEPSGLEDNTCTQFSEEQFEPLVERLDSAKASDHQLCYMGCVTAQGGRVGFTNVPARSRLADLNYIQFHTRLYNVEPLLLSGAGYRKELTAGSILGDMIGLARENY
ncbi:MAG: hypothetical protein AAF633_00310 [Chloroflexota bacterium]